MDESDDRCDIWKDVDSDESDTEDLHHKLENAGAVLSQYTGIPDQPTQPLQKSTEWIAQTDNSIATGSITIVDSNVCADSTDATSPSQDSVSYIEDDTNLSFSGIDDMSQLSVSCVEETSPHIVSTDDAEQQKLSSDTSFSANTSINDISIGNITDTSHDSSDDDSKRGWITSISWNKPDIYASSLYAAAAVATVTIFALCE